MPKRHGKRQRRNANKHRARAAPVAAPFPPRRPVKFTYSFSQNLVEAAAGAGTQQLWNLNSLYDPDASGVGHQPLYYDQMFSNAGPYQRYTVHTVDLSITVTNLVQTESILCGVYFQPGAVDLPARDLFQEKPYKVMVILGPRDGHSSTRVLQHRISIAKVLGVTRRKLMDDDQYSGFWNTNPAVIAYGIFMSYAMPPAPLVASVSVSTKLVFHGVAFGRSAIGSS